MAVGQNAGPFRRWRWEVASAFISALIFLLVDFSFSACLYEAPIYREYISKVSRVRVQENLLAEFIRIKRRRQNTR